MLLGCTLGLQVQLENTYVKEAWSFENQTGLRSLFWMLRSRCQMSLNNKRLILQPIWTYASSLWGTAADSNIEIIQRFQNLVLRKIMGAPWYVTNKQLHNDLKLETVKQTLERTTNKYVNRLHNRRSIESLMLLDSPANQRLRRKAVANINW